MIERTRETPEAPPFYGFRSDGGMARSEHGVHRQTTGLVQSLVKRRRESPDSPADLCLMIQSADCHAAFPSLEFWQAIREPALWSTAQTRTAAEETVKRCGRQDGRWHVHEWRADRAGEAPESHYRGHDKIRALLEEF